MMKLTITLAVLSAFIAISNGAAIDCPLNTKLSDTCGSITISGAKNGLIDGTYNRKNDALFQKSDGSLRFLSYYYGFGKELDYVGLELDEKKQTEIDGDRRCESGTGSYRVRFPAKVLDTIEVGDAVTFQPEFPSDGRFVTISCDTKSDEQAAAPTTKPTAPPTSVEGLGSICFGVTFPGDLTAPQEIKFSRLSGQYIEIPGGINGKPAYEAVNESDECGLPATLMYIGRIGNTIYERYYLVRNRNKPLDTYYLTCSNHEEIGNNDLSGGCEGGLSAYIKLSQGTDCTCGLVTE